MPASQHQSPKSDIEIAQASKPRRILDGRDPPVAVLEGAARAEQLVELHRQVVGVQLVGGAGAGTAVSLAPFVHSEVQFGAVLAGATLLGLVGALVAIPISAGVLLLVREMLFPRVDAA